MSAIVMDGRALSAELMPALHRHAAELRDRYRCVPTLAAVMVGDNPASRQYVRNKQRMANELRFGSRTEKLDPSATSAALLEVIDGLNRDPKITGILLQVPLPAQVDTFKLFDAIRPDKDVDGVGSASVSGFYRGQWGTFIPCTSRGILTFLRRYKVPVEGKRAVVIGRSDVAGKPTALILGGRLCNATVTWCHRHTHNLESICREADVLVPCVGVDVGRPHLITADMVKPGACVIDVGVRRVGPGEFVGDVDFEAVKSVAGWITPNPGGTGPMTVIGLMQNLIDAARYQLGLARASYEE